MVLRPRFMYSPLVVACACATLAVSSLAHSQTNLTPAEQYKNAKDAQAASGSVETSTREDWHGQEYGYSVFIGLVAGEEMQVQWDIQHGQEPTTRLNFAKILQIREDEEQVMRTLMIDADSKIREIQNQFLESDRAIQGKFDVKERAVKINAIVEQDREIVYGVIARLKQELGTEEFTKLDFYIFQTEKVGQIPVLHPQIEVPNASHPAISHLPVSGPAVHP